MGQLFCNSYDNNNIININHTGVTPAIESGFPAFPIAAIWPF